MSRNLLIPYNKTGDKLAIKEAKIHYKASIPLLFYVIFLALFSFSFSLLYYYSLKLKIENAYIVI